MTDHPRRVTRALLSVSDKTGLIEFIRPNQFPVVGGGGGQSVDVETGDGEEEG
jgi:AICAR transformylase/IMP cyclohydrolase PurH